MTDTTTMSSDPAVNPDLNAASGKENAAPTEVEIELGGAKMKVSPAVAEALKAADKAATDAKQAANAARSQLDEMNRRIAEAAGTPSKETKPDLAVLMYTDPEQYNTLMRAEIKQEVLADVARMTAQREFWGEFYSQNSDLKEFKEYVEFVFQRDLPQMAKDQLNLRDTIKKVADTVKGDLIKMRGKGGSGKPVAEGGSEGGNSGEGRGSKPDVSEDSPNAGLTGTILAERRAARMAAKQPGRKK